MSYSNSGDRDRPNTGVLFTNDRKTTDRHPDMTGYMVFDTDVIEALIKGHRANMPMKLQISAWMGRSNRGTDYLSIRFGTRDTPINREQAQGQAPQPMQRAPVQARTPMSQPRPFGGTPLNQGLNSGQQGNIQGPGQVGQTRQQPQTSIIDDEVPF